MARVRPGCSPGRAGGSPMRCPRCESDTPDGGKFCIECGSPLRPHCPRCGTEDVAQAKFCAECGTPLISHTPVTPSSRPPLLRRYSSRHSAEKNFSGRSALEEERKQVTVLFADLKGSLELLADQDPEDARQLLDP